MQYLRTAVFQPTIKHRPCTNLVTDRAHAKQNRVRYEEGAKLKPTHLKTRVPKSKSKSGSGRFRYLPIPKNGGYKLLSTHPAVRTNQTHINLSLSLTAERGHAE